MKKVIILACVAIILSAFFAVQETSATSYEEWSKDKETQFDEFICETCKEPTEPEPTEPEPTEPEPEVEPEPKSRKKSKCSGSIGNLVWNDANENGVKDGEEKGLDDVKITLKWAGEDYRWDNDDDEELTSLTDSLVLVKVTYYDLQTNEEISSTIYTSQISIGETSVEAFSISVPASETAVRYIATVNIWSGMIGAADWQPYSEKIELRGEFHP